MTKRIHTTMIVGLMAGIVMLAGCKREYGTVTLGANIDNGRDAKGYIDDLTPCGHNNDLIRVNNQTCTTSAALGSSAQITDVVESNHYRAIYPADIVGDVNISSNSTIAVTLPSVQQYEVDNHGDQKVKVPMGANSSNESLTFHNLCSLIKVVICNRTDDDFILDRITVTANSAYLSGQGSAIVSGSQTDAISLQSSSRHDVSLEFPSTNRPTIGRGDRDTYFYYIVAPEFAEDDVTFTLYSGSAYAAFNKQDITLHYNRIATVSLTVEQWDGDTPSNPPTDPTLEDGVLSGLFTINNNGGQVYFSKGNLQFREEDNNWRFAEHQYDNINVSPRSSSYTSDYWIDLFGWGTGNNPIRTSYNSNDYSTFVDWGVNAISNGGNHANTWRTLTYEEFRYIILNRQDASLKRGIGNIEGHNGLILLPDNWSIPAGCTFVSGYSRTWSHNRYTLVQWTAMEEAGAVFLPVDYYWTSTLCTSGENSGLARVIEFDEDGIMTYSEDSYQARPNCYSVRLVKDNE